MEKIQLDKGKLFSHLITNQNITRILLIGVIYSGIEVIGLIMSTLGFFESDIRLYVLSIVIFHIIYLPTLYIIHSKFLNSNKIKLLNLKILERIYYYVVFLWASVFTILMYIQDEDITVYSIVLLLVSALFILKPLHSNFLFGTNFIVFSTLIYMNVDNILVANGLVFKALIVCIISVVISQTNYKNRKNLFESNEKLMEINVTLRDKALRDSLTNLYNNGYMFDFLENAISDNSRCGGKFSLLMIDIDDFKNVNDKYGHLFGDKVICNISNKLMELTRSRDVVGRYGGEEFVIVLCDTKLVRAKEIAERIRKEIVSMKYEENIRVSVSIGIAEFNNHTSVSLVKEADENLYEAKRTGKNKVVA